MVLQVEQWIPGNYNAAGVDKEIMKRWKRSAFCILLCIALVLPLVGCAGAAKPSAKNPVTLTIWHTYVEQMGDAFAVLINEFNDTTGAQAGVRIEVAAIANATELNGRLMDAVNGVPGAPALPDLAVLYPKIALLLANKDLLTDFGAYFDDEELSRFVPHFLEEGKLGGEALYLLPVAKSTEVLYVNRTIFDRFAAETGTSLEQLATFEGIAAAAEKYYAWTDAQTPDIPGDGKAFYYPDALFNHAVIGFEQQGKNFLDGQMLNIQEQEYERIWETYYPLAVRGGVAVYNNFGNYLAMTGDAVCITGTSAGAIYYPDSVTYADNSKEDVTFDVLPYPVYEGGARLAMQRGGGICALKTEPKKAYAASVFLKWLTAPEQNLRFTASSGYLPVTQEAFARIAAGSTQYADNPMIQKMLATTAAMQESYQFHIPAVFESYDALSLAYGSELYELAKQDRKRYVDLLTAGEKPEKAWQKIAAGAYEQFVKKMNP